MTAPARLLGGRYEVGELLGYGGMAEVHRGRDLRLGRDVAIKMLRTDLARDQTFQIRFKREAQNAASLNHPAIVAVYDTGEETGPHGENLPYIVMEFVNGSTLKEVLGAEGRLQPRRAMELSADICAALDFSHRHGIIHRDVKPGNVMLNGAGQVKVMDFGIARALAGNATTMTQTSAVIGTAQYLSPEQARGEAVDARSDVYAAGCVLYELLCGHPPFVGDSPVSVAYQHVREDPRPPSQSNRDVTPDIDAIVLKALAKNPANRYQSAGEMRADLLRAVNGRPVHATPVLTEAERTAVIAAPRQTPTRQTARVGDPGRRKASNWVLVALALLAVIAGIGVVVGLLLTNKTETVPVPKVVGLTEADAKAQIDSAGLKPQATTPQTGLGCTKGQVTKTDPEAGKAVAKGSTVSYTVCGGPKQVPVPNVVGATCDGATNQLKSAGLVAKCVQESSDQQRGIVFATVPPVGSSVQEGTQVTVKTSKGDTKTVPPVVGLTRQEAEAQLRAQGFNVRVQFSTNVPDDQNNKVIDQNPDDQPAKTGDTVTITVGQKVAPPTQSSSPSPTPSSSRTP